MRAMYFGPPQRQLFGTMHVPVGTPRALVLICPPLLHEQQRSYRFFSQVADRFAEAGLACMRFDYFGTGDSGGEDGLFSPESARADITMAATELRKVDSSVPLIVMGVRGSALLVHRDAAELGASALWLWQPVLDGGDWLQALVARDCQERASRNRYPVIRMAAMAGDELMGTIFTRQAREELSALVIDDVESGIPMTILDAENAGGTGLAGATHYRLPDSVTAWADEIDLIRLISLRDAEAALHALLTEHSQWTPRSADSAWMK